MANSTPSPALLTTEDINQFKKDGWCIPKGFILQMDELKLLHSALTSLLESNPDVPPEKLVDAHLAKNKVPVESQPVLAGDGETFLKVGSNKTLCNIASLLLDTENIFLWGCHIFCKPGEHGKRVPWHQDAPYWPIEPMRAVTLWVALDDSDVNNGCLRVIPGSHLGLEFKHCEVQDENAALEAGIAESCEIDDQQQYRKFNELAVPVKLKAGQVSAHNPQLVHGSLQNKSKRRRAGITYLYMAAESHFNRANLKPASAGYGYESRPLYWVRGNQYNEKNAIVRDIRHLSQTA